MKNESSQIAEYSATEAALSDLSSRFKCVVFNVSETKGMDEAKKARAEVRGYRTSLEAKRKEIKAPALERCALIDAEAKRITAELVALEDPIDDQIKKEELRKESEKAAKAEAERIALAQIKTRVDNIKAWPLLAAAASPANVLDDIARLEALEIDDSFGASYGEAVEAKAVALAKLREIHAAKAAAEVEAARIRDELAAQAERNRVEREELDRQRAEQQRIDAAAQAERDAEEQRLATARTEIAEAQRVLDEAKAEAQRQADAAEREPALKNPPVNAYLRCMREAAAAQKTIDDVAAETKRAADAVAAKQSPDLTEVVADMLTDQGSVKNICAQSFPSSLRDEITAIINEMLDDELRLVLHYCERLTHERQVAA